MSEFKKLSQRERERQRRIERRTRPEQWCDWDTKQALCAVAKRLAQVRWAVTRKRGFDRANVLELLDAAEIQLALARGIPE
jgi:hypothetical protein